ncbi:MAG TPA: FAD-dependent oxidoreductase [Candidatus Competibacteraceae bacterium]|nr:FAD-dependent oxidoreductase [Candidatus Competibacteraceae bacterium]
MANRHIVVIGAGIVGVCTASYLLRDGCEVTLLDPQGAGEGASFGNAGALAVAEVVPLSTPGILWQVPGWLLDPLGPLAIRWHYLPRLIPWLWRFLRVANPRDLLRIATAQAGLMRTVFADFAVLLEDAGISHWLTRGGAMTLYRDDKARAADADTWALRARFGVRFEALDGAAIRAREPAIAEDWRHAVYTPDWGHVRDPYELTTALAVHAGRLGLRLLRGQATDFELAGGRVTAVRTADGQRLACDGVVIAAGAWSRPLAARLGSRVPLDCERGYHLTLPEPGVKLETYLLYADGGFVILPMSDGRIRLAGTVELGGLAAPPDYRRARVLLTKARAILPGLRDAGASEWMGHRPSLPDSLPVLGPAPHVTNAWFAFGHGHLGLTQAATSGRIVADLAAGRDPGLDLGPYRADRF